MKEEPEKNYCAEKKEEVQVPKQELEKPAEEGHCRWRKEWKKKMEEKMASFIDDRLENLIPCLAQKIEAYLKK